MLSPTVAPALLLPADARRREWNRVNAARSRARRKYINSCVEERREALVRENHAILALLERSGVAVSASLLQETIEASEPKAGAAAVPAMNAAQMVVVDGGFVRLTQGPLNDGTATGAAGTFAPGKALPRPRPCATPSPCTCRQYGRLGAP